MMLKKILVLIIVSTAFCTHSKQVSVSVVSESDVPIGNVVVYFSSTNSKPNIDSDSIAIMDQVNKQFSPHILVIQRDSQVHFPNSDLIKHHVYSFSKAKTFEIQLYKELQAKPLLFSDLGPVELGCNIHDWMLGYIYVVNTPYFSKTDGNGIVLIDLPEDEYQLNIWHPRIKEGGDTLSRLISIPQESNIRVKLNSALLPDVTRYDEQSNEFSDYE